jgi:hypothetical protein
MAKYRKKPIVIEAIQFDANDINTQEHVNFGYPKAEGDTELHRLDGIFWIQTLEGEHIVSQGDWIITGIKGEHYPCKPDIFEATYEAA